MMKLFALIWATTVFASAVEDDVCRGDHEFCLGKKRSAETLLQAGKAKLAAKRLSAHDDFTLPPQRLPRQTILVAEKSSYTLSGGTLCAPVGIEIMTGAPPEMKPCEDGNGESMKQCGLRATVGQNVGHYDGDFEPILEKGMEWPSTVSETFLPWPGNTEAVVIGVMVGHTWGKGTLLDTRIIRLLPGKKTGAFKIAFDVNEDGTLTVSFPDGPFTAEPMSFPKDVWLLEQPCPGSTTMTTTQEPDVCLSKNTLLSFANARMAANNLGNEFGELRYEGIITQDGRSVDLVVTKKAASYNAGGGYNGVKTKGTATYGIVSLSTGGAVDLKFAFQDTETKEPVVIDVLHLHLFDFDGNSNEREEVYVDGISAYVVDPRSAVETDLADDGKVVFRSTAIGDDTDDPSSSVLSLAQKKKAVILMFEGQSSFDVTLKTPCTGTCQTSHRTFYFGGESSLSQPCSENMA